MDPLQVLSVLNAYSHIRNLSLKLKRRKLRKNLQGYYTAYDFVEIGSDQRNKNPTGCVKILIGDEDKFYIGHFSDLGETIWNGEISILNPMSRFLFRYEKVRGENYTLDRHRGGHKTISKTGNGFLLDGEKGYGQELLIPNRNNTVKKTCQFCGKIHKPLQ